MTIEQEVARHYGHGTLGEVILAGLVAQGCDPERLQPEDLAPVDEFHMGGREATAALAEALELQPGLRLLDLGCGLGGAARFFAQAHGCRVTGIDLTPDYVAVGNNLTRRVGLEALVRLQVASALDLPFEAGSFERATLLHVGMNIPDKPRLFSEVARVLAPGGLFGLYDVMGVGAGPLDYPTPWAGSATTSFIATPEDYRQGLAAVGFEVLVERNRRELALAFFRRMRARVAEAGPPPLGLHLLMGAEAKAKVANVIAGLEGGAIAPVELIARRR